MKLLYFWLVRQIAVIAFLIYYGMGSILFPLGDLSYVKDLPEMYRNCALEDPDINIADFVFEHLANIQGNDEGGNEKPHQPTFSHTPVQVLVVVATKLKIQILTPVIRPIATVYPIPQNQGELNSTSASVFRPPIV